MKLLSVFLLVGIFSTNALANTNGPKLMRMVCYGVRAGNSSVQTGSVMVIEQVDNATYDGRVLADPTSDAFLDELMTNDIPFKLKYYQNVSTHVSQSKGDDETLMNSLALAEENNQVDSEKLDWVGSRTSTSLTNHNYSFVQEGDESNSLIIQSGKENQVAFRNGSWFDMFDCKAPFMVDAPEEENTPEPEEQTAEAGDVYYDDETITDI